MFVWLILAKQVILNAISCYYHAFWFLANSNFFFFLSAFSFQCASFVISSYRKIYVITIADVQCGEKKNYLFFVFSFQRRISISDWVERRTQQTDSLKCQREKKRIVSCLLRTKWQRMMNKCLNQTEVFSTTIFAC